MLEEMILSHWSFLDTKCRLAFSTVLFLDNQKTIGVN
ncbi:hypothetical protein V512_013265 [Mesotoga sp. Brook.08.105.5.1]|nr:hypothetical protein V512_013265 [Mesotoga sp. Brook.08.105.5.1]